MENTRRSNAELNKVLQLLKKFEQINRRHLPYFLNEEIVKCNTLCNAARERGLCGYDQETNTLYLKSHHPYKFDVGLCKAIDVLISLSKSNPIEDIVKIDNTDRPDVLFFSLKDNIFDVLFYPKNEEKQSEEKLNELGIESNFILILEDISQIEAYRKDNIKYYCYVSGKGEVSYID